MPDQQDTDNKPGMSCKEAQQAVDEALDLFRAALEEGSCDNCSFMR